MKLLVVGAGIAGSMFTRHAREHGHDVTVMADPARQRSSEVAVCVIRRSWFHGPALEAADYALAYYDERGWLIRGDEVTSSYRRPQRRAFRNRTFGIDPRLPLVDPDLPVEWVAGRADSGWITVLCRGASGSDLPWKRLWGATSIIHAGPEQPTIIANEERPRFTTFGLGIEQPDGSKSIRFGSTSGASADAALARQVVSERSARAAGQLPAGTPLRLTGCRLMPPKAEQAGALRRLAPTVYAIEGFGRVGYSLAPLLTRQHLTTIERNHP